PTHRQPPDASKQCPPPACAVPALQRSSWESAPGQTMTLPAAESRQRPPPPASRPQQSRQIPWWWMAAVDRFLPANRTVRPYQARLVTAALPQASPAGSTTESTSRAPPTQDAGAGSNVANHRAAPHHATAPPHRTAGQSDEADTGHKTPARPKAVQAAGWPAPPTTKLVTGYGVDSKQGVRRAPPPTFRLALLEPLFPPAAPGLPLGNYSPAPNLPITP